MKTGAPFGKSRAMIAAIRAALIRFQGDTVGLQSALTDIGPYESKRKVGSRGHSRRTVRRDQRAALKKRNRRRNKLAHRRHGK